MTGSKLILYRMQEGSFTQLFQRTGGRALVGSSILPILYFHSVSDERSKSWYKSYLTVSATLFETLLKYFVRRGFRFVTLGDYCNDRDLIASGRNICITFDDGYLDNYQFVYPLLKKYRARATIFVSPCYVDTSGITSENPRSEGFLTWEMMKEMESSGLVDIQSHTMTHSKVYASDRIRDFHNPCSDWLYPVTNAFPERRPYYISDERVKKLLPYGTPFLEETSAVTTRRVEINPSFSEYCVEKLQNTDWSRYSFRECFKLVENEYISLKAADELILSRESKEDYEHRVKWEIEESKKIIEEKLDKEVRCICWPHGDYNQFCVDTAFQAGYSLVHAVEGKGPVPDASFTRIGVTEGRFSTISALRVIAKVQALRGRFPYTLLPALNRLLSSSRRTS